MNKYFWIIVLTIATSSMIYIYNQTLAYQIIFGLFSMACLSVFVSDELTNLTNTEVEKMKEIWILRLKAIMVFIPWAALAFVSVKRDDFLYLCYLSPILFLFTISLIWQSFGLKNINKPN